MCEQERKRLKKEEFDASWKCIQRDNLNISYKILFSRSESRELFTELEREVEYLSGELAKVKVFGKVYNIPRKQAAYGDPGIKYKYSGTSITAKSWSPTLLQLRDLVKEATGHTYNFVLVNRYKDGMDKMGFHKDDEKELCRETPIASLTLGAERDFVFKHEDKAAKIVDEKLLLQDGLLLLMHAPTNRFWYHAIPQRKACKIPRINLTFRQIKQQ